jgi:Fe-S-cluster containining protein
MTGKSIGSEPEILGINDSFNFSCSKELDCFNKCCRDINLYLTAYDILRIKRRLRILSSEFLKTYTVPLFPEEIGHPVILMKMIPDESKHCPFVSEDGCLIYDDRPWSCRSFPVEPVSEYPLPEFTLIKRDFCLGFGKGNENALRKWRDTQNLAFYEEINDAWKKVTHHPNFTDKNLVEGEAREIFFLGSYNLDEFRNLVFKGDFLKYFQVEKKTLKKIKSNDTELLLFACKWMRHVLFGDDTLKRKHCT